MDKVIAFIKSKPRIFVFITLVYLLIVGVFKWLFHPSLDAIWFLLGGVIGLYLLDAAESFFALSPSPFRSIVFFALFVAVAFFVITSSSGTIGSGLVLSLYLQLLLWQIGQWRVQGNVDSWFGMIASPVNVSTQRFILAMTIIIFLVETYLFIR